MRQLASSCLSALLDFYGLAGLSFCCCSFVFEGHTKAESGSPLPQETGVLISFLSADPQVGNESPVWFRA